LARIAGRLTVRDAGSASRRVVDVSLMIPTHALPPLSYEVPSRLAGRVSRGSAVIAPLSGRTRLGVVVNVRDDEPGSDLEELRGMEEGLSLPPVTVDLCGWVSEAAAISLPAALRAALMPGIETGKYRVSNPGPGWPWKRGDLVSRTALLRELGREDLREAEAAGKIVLSPRAPVLPVVEWAVLENAAGIDLSRAPRQKEMVEALSAAGGALPVPELISRTGGKRDALLRLARRGCARIEKRRELSGLIRTEGEARRARRRRTVEAGRVLEGGAWILRTPTVGQMEAVYDLALAGSRQGRSTLVLAPEIRDVERLAGRLARSLPCGLTVATYHSGLGRERAAVYRAAGSGDVDVLVGTRAAALLPLAGLGAICVVDEPNEAHRARSGFEGLPIHARDVALRRAGIEDAGLLMLSPTPSLRVYGAARRQELPAVLPERRPVARIVDMRGSGAMLSSTLLDTCRDAGSSGKRLGLVANRLGWAGTLICNRCGAVRCCPRCDLPLALLGRSRSSEELVCGRCGYRAERGSGCSECGSERMSLTGTAAERLREEISVAIESPVGLLAGSTSEREDAGVVVGTVQRILAGEWDVVAIPDVDAMLLAGGMGAVERAFRWLYQAGEAARELLIVQTRSPEHYALRAALRGDYEGFAAAELPRLRALGYPPYAHLAELVLEGPEDAVRHAVESEIGPALPAGVGISGPVPFSRSGESSWRVLLRSPDRSRVARAGTVAARLVAKSRGGVRALVNVDPEEV
jgi:primosomal protein N' (replication factor Y)